MPRSIDNQLTAKKKRRDQLDKEIKKLEAQKLQKLLTILAGTKRRELSADISAGLSINEIKKKHGLKG